MMKNVMSYGFVIVVLMNSTVFAMENKVAEQVTQSIATRTFSYSVENAKTFLSWYFTTFKCGGVLTKTGLILSPLALAGILTGTLKDINSNWDITESIKSSLSHTWKNIRIPSKNILIRTAQHAFNEPFDALQWGFNNSIKKNKHTIENGLIRPWLPYPIAFLSFQLVGKAINSDTVQNVWERVMKTKLSDNPKNVMAMGLTGVLSWSIYSSGLALFSRMLYGDLWEIEMAMRNATVVDSQGNTQKLFSKVQESLIEPMYGGMPQEVLNLLEQYKMAFNNDTACKSDAKFKRFMIFSGLPGIGKTALAAEIARYLNAEKLRFFELHGSKIASIYRDGQAQLINQAFQEIINIIKRNPDKIYVFNLNEVESMLQSRNKTNGDNSTDASATSTFMDNLEKLLADYANVILIGSSNNVSGVDHAIHRRSVLIHLKPAEDDKRLVILDELLKKKGFEATQETLDYLNYYTKGLATSSLQDIVSTIASIKDSYRLNIHNSIDKQMITHSLYKALDSALKTYSEVRASIQKGKSAQDDAIVTEYNKYIPQFDESLSKLKQEHFYIELEQSLEKLKKAVDAFEGTLEEIEDAKISSSDNNEKTDYTALISLGKENMPLKNELTTAKAKAFKETLDNQFTLIQDERKQYANLLENYYNLLVKTPEQSKLEELKNKFDEKDFSKLEPKHIETLFLSFDNTSLDKEITLLTDLKEHLEKVSKEQTYTGSEQIKKDIKTTLEELKKNSPISSIKLENKKDNNNNENILPEESKDKNRLDDIETIEDSLKEKDKITQKIKSVDELITSKTDELKEYKEKIQKIKITHKEYYDNFSQQKLTVNEGIEKHKDTVKNNIKNLQKEVVTEQQQSVSAIINYVDNSTLLTTEMLENYDEQIKNTIKLTNTTSTNSNKKNSSEDEEVLSDIMSDLEDEYRTTDLKDAIKAHLLFNQKLADLSKNEIEKSLHTFNGIRSAIAQEFGRVRTGFSYWINYLTGGLFRQRLETPTTDELSIRQYALMLSLAAQKAQINVESKSIINLAKAFKKTITEENDENNKKNKELKFNAFVGMMGSDRHAVKALKAKLKIWCSDQNNLDTEIKNFLSGDNIIKIAEKEILLNNKSQKIITPEQVHAIDKKLLGLNNLGNVGCN